ncbi:hypothetical protein ABE28_015885 [Peribacillus muralis]|uniref:Uncharacterized protein n=1 Tax=Peribacillus muralis TaxID=264697 RepID=A0A1B3XRI7_9BACI|nr:hypothetical protein ABE28_015885 [Peribacillus muralis]
MKLPVPFMNFIKSIFMIRNTEYRPLHALVVACALDVIRRNDVILRAFNPKIRDSTVQVKFAPNKKRAEPTNLSGLPVKDSVHAPTPIVETRCSQFFFTHLF